MLIVNWDRFGNRIRGHAGAERLRLCALEKLLGLSHARVVDAANGKPVGTAIFLTLCHWMRVDPMLFAQLPEDGE